jgi:hypothetical protein
MVYCINGTANLIFEFFTPLGMKIHLSTDVHYKLVLYPEYQVINSVRYILFLDKNKHFINYLYIEIRYI